MRIRWPGVRRPLTCCASVACFSNCQFCKSGRPLLYLVRFVSINSFGKILIKDVGLFVTPPLLSRSGFGVRGIGVDNPAAEGGRQLPLENIDTSECCPKRGLLDPGRFRTLRNSSARTTSSAVMTYPDRGVLRNEPSDQVPPVSCDIGVVCPTHSFQDLAWELLFRQSGRSQLGGPCQELLETAVRQEACCSRPLMTAVVLPCGPLTRVGCGD